MFFTSSLLLHNIWLTYNTLNLFAINSVPFLNLSIHIYSDLLLNNKYLQLSKCQAT
jgi:hypothetical protein